MSDITGGFKKLKEDLSRMTFKEKVNHLWTYYKSTLLIAVIAVAVVSVMITGVINANSDIIVSGVAVNVYLSEEGKQYLGDDYYNKVYDGSGLEKVDFAEMPLYDLSDVEHAQDTEYALMALAALISEGELDYILVDQSALTSFIKYGEILQDLRNLFPEEDLKKQGSKVAHMRLEEDGEDIPIAFDISDLPFILDNSQQGGNPEKPIYLVFTLNSPREDACRAIYQYILDWKK